MRDMGTQKKRGGREGCKIVEGMWWYWVVGDWGLEEGVGASLNTLFSGKERGSDLGARVRTQGVP